jgi:hypothetical protein
MTTLKTIAAAAVLSVLAATPVFAQAAIQEPGAFAFYHPNADVLNRGAPTPSAGLAAVPPSAYDAQASTVYVPRHLPRHGSHHANH